MFDQALGALMLMFQRLAPLHGEQQQLIRQEVDRLQEITRELQALEADLAGRAPLAPPASLSSPPCDVFAGSPSEGRVGTTEDPTEPAADIHELLCQRLTAMQEEREGGWQRVLNFLVGKVKAPIV
jgi:hypothetical protein